MIGRPKGSLDLTTLLDQTAFDVLTPESEYWVGFLMADGCVNYSKTGRAPRISLLVATKDAEHIHKFARFLKTNRKVQVTNESVRLQVASYRLVDALSQYGVGPRKSFSAEVIGLENSRDFWRGVIDGDGSLVLTGKKPPQLRLVGSERLLRQWVSYIGFGRLHRHGSIYRVAISGRRAVEMVRRLYGSGDVVALDRKKAKAEDLLRWKPRHKSRPESVAA